MIWDQTKRHGPPKARPNELVRSAVLAGPCAAFSAGGDDVSGLLAKSGLSSQQILNPESILPAGQYLDALARIGHASDDGFLFYAGASTHLDDFGLAGQAVQSATTFGEAIDLTRQILGYLQSSSIIEIKRVGGLCHLHYSAGLGETEEVDPDLQYSIGVLSSIVCQGEHAFDPELAVYLPRARNLQAGPLPLNTRFIESRTAMITFDERLMQSAMPKTDADKAEVLRRFLKTNSIVEASQNGMADTVRQLLDCTMGIAKPSQQIVCRLLSISARSLQRALNREGTSFRQILDSSRKWAAFRELRAGRGVTETAFMLGYDHPQNFTTACYRWFGKPPSSL